MLDPDSDIQKLILIQLKMDLINKIVNTVRKS